MGMKQESFQELIKLPPVRLLDCQAEIRRELEMRRSVYPRWVKEGKVDQYTADWRIKVLEGVLETLDIVERLTKRIDRLAE